MLVDQGLGPSLVSSSTFTSPPFRRATGQSGKHSVSQQMTPSKAKALQKSPNSVVPMVHPSLALTLGHVGKSSRSNDAQNILAKKQILMGNHEAAMRSMTTASDAVHETPFRQLPCRTFLSVGICPYKERCVFLHDPRCACSYTKVKTRKKNLEDVASDTFCWPAMTAEEVGATRDFYNLPKTSQNYCLPSPHAQSTDDEYPSDLLASFSLWMHFVEFCALNNKVMEAQLAAAADPVASSASHLGSRQKTLRYNPPNEEINTITGRRRLPVFVRLSRPAEFGLKNQSSSNLSDMGMSCSANSAWTAHLTAVTSNEDASSDIKDDVSQISMHSF